ncbi:hypothetical protein [Nakamurella leprariae]|uniref:SnoaL-like domain-containing protein n=1 Tax=Nakamurella leprariae TaxID=2803911 RepID=A0A939C2Q9_9ACTN|nr:hypothetical protein [Nakamurella leprariae]MBM9468549.1 hypothetical protein [Nakamurella leprariae]
MSTHPGIDPLDSIRKLQARLDQVDGATRRTLQTSIDRLAAELVGDVEGIMRTLADDFHLVNVAPDGTRTEGPRGAAVRAAFEGLCAGGQSTVWVEWEQFAVDAHTFAGIGAVRMVVPAGLAAAMGIPADPAAGPDARYSTTSHSAVFIDFDDQGLMTSETVFADPTRTVRRLAGPDEQFDNRQLAARLG